MTGVLLAALMWLVLSDKRSTSGGYQLYTLMDDVSGLARSSQVRIAGVPVGRIESINLEGDVARVTIDVDRTIELYEDAQVTKVATSILGEFYLSARPGTPGRRPLRDGDRVNFTSSHSASEQVLRDGGLGLRPAVIGP
jgi:phospholipid/cholesterol/gamma-HCH transport system substrate-binding protein